MEYCVDYYAAGAQLSTWAIPGCRLASFVWRMNGGGCSINVGLICYSCSIRRVTLFEDTRSAE